MSASNKKKWADESSSEEGSVDDQEDDQNLEESEPEEQPVQRQTQPKSRAPPQRIEIEDEGSPYLIMVASIKFSASRDMLGEFFEKNGCVINSLDLWVDDRGQSKGIAVMEVDDFKSYSICLHMNGVSFKGLPLKTRKYVPKSEPSYGAREPRGSHRVITSDRPHNERGRHQDARKMDGRERRDHHSSDARREDGRRGNFHRQERGERESGHDTSRAAPPVVKESALPVSRPKLNLVPRSKPIEEIGKPVSKPDIFGGGRPHNAQEYEEKKKKEEQEQKERDEIIKANQKTIEENQRTIKDKEASTQQLKQETKEEKSSVDSSLPASVDKTPETSSLIVPPIPPSAEDTGSTLPTEDHSVEGRENDGFSGRGKKDRGAGRGTGRNSKGRDNDRGGRGRGARAASHGRGEGGRGRDYPPRTTEGGLVVEKPSDAAQWGSASTPTSSGRDSHGYRGGDRHGGRGEGKRSQRGPPTRANKNTEDGKRDDSTTTPAEEGSQQGDRKEPFRGGRGGRGGRGERGEHSNTRGERKGRGGRGGNTASVGVAGEGDKVEEASGSGVSKEKPVAVEGRAAAGATRNLFTAAVQGISGKKETEKKKDPAGKANVFAVLGDSDDD